VITVEDLADDIQELASRFDEDPASLLKEHSPIRERSRHPSHRL
jgi:hypothetical protein